MAELISIDVDALADRVAELVVERLRGGTFGDLVDQSESPLGRRRHIALVRKGGPGVARVGRRYLASRAVISAELARPNAPPTTDLAAPDGTALLRKIGL